MSLRNSPSGPFVGLADLAAEEGLALVRGMATKWNEVLAYTTKQQQAVSPVDIEIADAEQLARTWLFFGYTVIGSMSAADIALVEFQLLTPSTAPSSATMTVRDIRGSAESATPSIWNFRSSWWGLKNAQGVYYGPPLEVGTNQIWLDADVSGSATVNIAAADLRLYVAQLEGSPTIQRGI
ncbi:MAG: hypothetical protein JSV86_18490 [Gemmatimonadota bacterium]|nr:MAG: hypothetical protein JSV86_18490 [Gemmatimonadota bacterium]